MNKAFGIFIIFSFCICVSTKADIRLPSVISSGMVLQQKTTVKLWGWGDVGEKVVVMTSWNNGVDSVKTNENAKWQIAIQTPAAGGPYTITLKGNNTVVLQNVLIGEVWFCSGQSNMEMNYLWGLPQMKEDIPAANNPNIRFFHVPRNTAQAPQENGEGKWVQSDTNSVKWFSAVAYYFGKKLNGELNVPVALIHASWGGTPAEVWTPAEVVRKDEVLDSAAKKLNRSNGWPITPGYTFNAMISPITNYTIAGAIWYQGESNTGTAPTYYRLFSSMIKSWRERWDKEFPFYYVQLAPFNYGNNLIGAQLREAQAETLILPKTGMVVTTDLAEDTSDIHPRNKKDVGFRLANLALADTYGLPIRNVKSPLYNSMKIEQNKVLLSFTNVDSGLTYEGKVIKGFSIAGGDRVFYPADVKINGQTIEVWNKAVKEPGAVRYAYSNTAVGNVFSKGGLPLAPFRTDNWK